MNPKRIAVYGRVSTDAQNHASQLREVRSYVRRRWPKAEVTEYLDKVFERMKAEGRRQKDERQLLPSAFCLLPSAFMIMDRTPAGTLRTEHVGRQISLAGWVRLRLRPLPTGRQASTKKGERVSRDVTGIELEPRSVYLMAGDVRWGWQHSVAPARSIGIQTQLQS